MHEERADQLCVAVVDDDATTRRMFRAWFEGDGCTVHECSCGAEALERVSRADVDALCLDLGMADIAGFEVLAQVREVDADLPVVIVTARREFESVVEAMRLGASDYLCKPLDPSRVVHAVRRAVQARRRLEVLRRARVEIGLDESDPRTGAEVVVPLREIEKRAIGRALRVAKGNVPRAARLLGMGRATLYRRLSGLYAESSAAGAIEDVSSGVDELASIASFGESERGPAQS